MKIIALLFVTFLFVACAKPVQVSSPADPLQDIKQTIRNEFPYVPQLSTSELDAWMQEITREQPLLLDVRTPEEFAVSHLPRAKYVGDDFALLAALKDYPKNKPIVIYCSVGYRSSVLAGRLRSNRFTKVFNLEGSIFQWANEGRPVYRGEQQVKQVHPFDAKWGELLKPELRAPTP